MELRGLKQKNHRGFSLIEILIVLVIIGIAGSISISGFGSAINKNEKRELKKIIQFLDSKINHVFQTGEVLEIQFNHMDATIKDKSDSLHLNGIMFQQYRSDIKNMTNKFNIYLSQKSLIETIHLSLKESSKETKLKLGLNGVEVQ